MMINALEHRNGSNSVKHKVDGYKQHVQGWCDEVSKAKLSASGDLLCPVVHVAPQQLQDHVSVLDVG